MQQHCSYPRNPQEVEALEPAAKARLGVCERPKGIPPMSVPSAQASAEPAARDRYWRLPGSRRPLPPRREVSRTFGERNLSPHGFAPSSGEPRGQERAPRGESVRPDRAAPSPPHRGAAAAPPTPRHLNLGRNPRAPPESRPLSRGGVPGQGGPQFRRGAVSPGPHSPAGSQASSSAHHQRPRGAMARTPPPPPPPADVALTVPPLPWHLSLGRALPPAAVPSLCTCTLRWNARQNTSRQFQELLLIYIYIYVYIYIEKYIFKTKHLLYQN